MPKAKLLCGMIIFLTSIGSQADPCFLNAKNESHKHHGSKSPFSLDDYFVTNTTINQPDNKKQKDCKVKSETISMGNNSTITNTSTICGIRIDDANDNIVCTDIICNIFN